MITSGSPTEQFEICVSGAYFRGIWIPECGGHVTDRHTIHDGDSDDSDRQTVRARGGRRHCRCGGGEVGTESCAWRKTGGPDRGGGAGGRRRGGGGRSCGTARRRRPPHRGTKKSGPRPRQRHLPSRDPHPTAKKRPKKNAGAPPRPRASRPRPSRPPAARWRDRRWVAEGGGSSKKQKAVMTASPPRW